MKSRIWFVWIFLTLAVVSYFGYTLLFADDKQALVIGDASHGHYQIELDCGACHTDAFGGKEMLQDACLNCHQQELVQAHDSHPKKKFNDPRNADRLKILDARYCISCHTGHQKEQTHPMGLTIPEDYCYHCHRDIGSERESHRDLSFDSCASAGCHNYHDNRALYETFLVENADQAWLDAIARIPEANSAAKVDPGKHPSNHLAFEAIANDHPDIHEHWAASSHAAAGVSCGGCHSNVKAEWIEKPGVTECESCHTRETEGFLAGKHGMRIAQGLSAVSPADSELPFKPLAQNVQHGCTTCHGAHSFDTQYAATDACLTCHNDKHSQAFYSSPHGHLALSAARGEIPREKAVTCASCHMPRFEIGKDGTEVVTKRTERRGRKEEKKSVKRKGSATEETSTSVADANREETIMVQHNQNLVLRPNEKMIRPVCMQCHSLAFSIDALADPALIDNNFSDRPAKHVPSIDWALQRDQDKNN